MTFSDTLAYIVGEHEKKPLKFTLWEDEKSLQGSAAMFLSTTMIFYIGTDFLHGYLELHFSCRWKYSLPVQHLQDWPPP